MSISTPRLATLRARLERQGGQSRVHQNTICHRLQKILAITALNLNDPAKQLTVPIDLVTEE
jgi:sugar diacid utilization regulator